MQKYEPHVFNKGTDREMTCSLPTNEYADHLRAIFQKISAAMHAKGKGWKETINIEVALTAEEAAEAEESVGFICGSPCDVSAARKPGHYRVQAPGYYRCVGA